MTDTDCELEELVLKEAVVSATGLDAHYLQIGIKGDPSLRETASLRERYHSVLDDAYEEFGPVLEDLLINRGIYQIFIGFNNAEIRTRSIFDPLREEIHSAEKFLNKNYVDRHYPEMPYEEKIHAMRDLYNYLFSSKYFQRIPRYWQNISSRRHAHWEPMQVEEISLIFKTLGIMRSMDDYYLRNTMISIVQSVVRMQFNCDGTQIVRAKDFKQFIEENLP